MSQQHDLPSLGKQQVLTDQAPAPTGPYSQGIRGAGLVFVSGQDPIDPKTGQEPEGFGAQVQAVLNNVESILIAAGSNRESILKVSIFLSDPTLFDELNRCYSEFFSGTVPPTRTTVCVPHLHHSIEVDCVALSPSAISGDSQ